VGAGSQTLALELPGGGGSVTVEVLSGEAGWETVLAEADAIVLCAPDTPETTRVVDARALARMKRSAVLVNVGRGGLVDEAALTDALRTGRIRGAALDVFDREPLADDHPFWALPNVLITPHVSAVTTSFWERETRLIVENIGRLGAGQPLLNVVDRERGY
jgi:phosphoglycerate dehydrogenase-like enzyme